MLLLFLNLEMNLSFVNFGCNWLKSPGKFCVERKELQCLGCAICEARIFRSLSMDIASSEWWGREDGFTSYYGTSHRDLGFSWGNAVVIMSF